MNNVIETEGETKEEAIEEALKELGVERDKAKIEILEEPNKGLLGLRKSKARVRVSMVDHESIVVEVIEEMLKNFGVEATIETRYEENYLWATLSGKSLSWMIGHHGQTLDAIQVLVGAIIGCKLKESARVIVDVEGYRERSQKEVRAMAERTVGKVLARGEAISLRPMNALERKLVHLVVAEYGGAKSSSIDTEPNRFVIISPA